MRKKRFSAYWKILLICFFSPGSSGIFFTGCQFSAHESRELIVHGAVTTPDSNRYDFKLIPGYLPPLENASVMYRQGWRWISVWPNPSEPSAVDGILADFPLAECLSRNSPNMSFSSGQPALRKDFFTSALIHYPISFIAGSGAVLLAPAVVTSQWGFNTVVTPLACLTETPPSPERQDGYFVRLTGNTETAAHTEHLDPENIPETIASCVKTSKNQISDTPKYTAELHSMTVNVIIPLLKHHLGIYHSSEGYRQWREWTPSGDEITLRSKWTALRDRILADPVFQICVDSSIESGWDTSEEIGIRTLLCHGETRKLISSDPVLAHFIHERQKVVKPLPYPQRTRLSTQVTYVSNPPPEGFAYTRSEAMKRSGKEIGETIRTWRDPFQIVPEAWKGFIIPRVVVITIFAPVSWTLPLFQDVPKIGEKTVQRLRKASEQDVPGKTLICLYGIAAAGGEEAVKIPCYTLQSAGIAVYSFSVLPLTVGTSLGMSGLSYLPSEIPEGALTLFSYPVRAVEYIVWKAEKGLTPLRTDCDIQVDDVEMPCQPYEKAFKHHRGLMTLRYYRPDIVELNRACTSTPLREKLLYSASETRARLMIFDHFFSEQPLKAYKEIYQDNVRKNPQDTESLTLSELKPLFDPEDPVLYQTFQTIFRQKMR